MIEAQADDKAVCKDTMTGYRYIGGFPGSKSHLGSAVYVPRLTESYNIDQIPLRKETIMEASGPNNDSLPPVFNISAPSDVTALSYAATNTHYRDSLNQWHHRLIPSVPEELWLCTVQWEAKHKPGKNLMLEAKFQIQVDVPGIGPPIPCPVNYPVLMVDQLLKIYRYHDIPQHIQAMFSIKDRGKADKQALHDWIDDQLSVPSNISGGDGASAPGTDSVYASASCILASVHAEPGKWAGFLGEAMQSGSEVLSGQAHTEAISAHPSTTTAPSTLDH
jgi:hypothetical protein